MINDCLYTLFEVMGCQYRVLPNQLSDVENWF